MDEESIISAQWGTTSASIVLDIKAINEKFESLCGYVPPTEYELALRKRVDDLLEEAFNRRNEQSQDDLP